MIIMRKGRKVTRLRRGFGEAKPLVSVIMPAYNAGEFLMEAIESIKNQTYKNWELIVVNDGSTDNSWEILKAFKKKNPKRFKIYRFDKNRGESQATNFAFSKTRGQFIARMDADDIAYPKRFEKQVRFLLKNPEVIVVGSQATVIDRTGQVIGQKKLPLTHKRIYRHYALYHPMHYPSVMINKSLYPKKRLCSNSCGINEDYMTLLKLLQYGKFANLAEPLLHYRIHGANKSLQKSRDKFINTVRARIMAVKKYGYKAPFWMWLAIALQGLVAYLVPEKLIMPAFFTFRGIIGKREPQRVVRKRSVLKFEKRDGHLVMVIPTFNEGTVIRRTIKKIFDFKDRVFVKKLSVLIVDGGSEDKTQEVVRKLKKVYKNLYLIDARKRGLGLALKKGLEYAIDMLGASFVATCDADGSHDFRELSLMFDKLKNVDIVVGSRYIAGGKINGWSLWRRILSLLGNFYIKTVTGVNELNEFTSNYRVFKRSVIENMRSERVFQIKDWSFLTLFLLQAYLNGLKIREHPILFSNRKAGYSKLNTVSYSRRLLWLAFEFRAQRFLVKVPDFVEGFNLFSLRLARRFVSLFSPFAFWLN